MNMNLARWTRLKGIFHTALEQPAAQRQRYVEQACGSDADLRQHLEALLRIHEDGDAADFAAPLSAAALLGPPAGALAGQQIGPYVLERLLGAGGMGSVWLARRADGAYDKTVAIKLTRSELAGPEVLRRFELERQALANLDHPNIARLIDGGALPDGRPYLVMEYVAGEPICAHCTRQGLPLAQRLRLFQQICSAVHHAHQNLIVHCDIKPANILVTPEGTPKLLDFGVSRLISLHAQRARTLTGQRFLTPEYASPEQVRGEWITTATDVYSLGMVLYELVTGEYPYRVPTESRAEIERAVCEQNPQRPSARRSRAAQARANGAPAPLNLAPRIARYGLRAGGDLDNIILMALRKEPARRYSSVEQFASDIERYLSRRPVLARPSSLGYRISKFVGRNRAGCGLAALLLASLAAGAGGLVLHSNVVREQRDRAWVEEAKTQRMNRFLSEMLSSGDVQSDRAKLTVHEVLDRAAARLADDAGESPEVLAAVRVTIGRAYGYIGQYAQAQQHLTRALEDLRRIHRTPSRPLAEALEALGTHRYQMGDFGGARPLLSECLETWRRLPGATGLDVARGLNNLAVVERGAGALDRAEALHREALALRSAAGGPRHLDVAESLNNLANVLRVRGDTAAAIPLLLEALEIRREKLGLRHGLVIQTLENLAVLYGQAGDFDRAEALGREALDALRGLWGDRHPNVALSLQNLGGVMLMRGQFTRAEQLFRDALEIRRAALPPDNWKIAQTEAYLAKTLLMLHSRDEALPLLYSSVPRLHAALGESSEFYQRAACWLYDAEHQPAGN